MLLDKINHQDFSPLNWLGGLRPSLTPAGSGALRGDSDRHIFRETVSEGDAQAGGHLGAGRAVPYLSNFLAAAFQDL